jgi:hypothetical protein
VNDIDWDQVAEWDDISDEQLGEEVARRLLSIEEREDAARLSEAGRERMAGQIEELRSALRHERHTSGCLFFALFLAAFLPFVLSWWRGTP